MDIKYRVWDKIKKEWATAHYITINPNGQIYHEGLNVTNNYDIEFFTGIRDCTCTEEFPNGKDIYEGDKVKAPYESYDSDGEGYENGVFEGVVIFEDGCFCVKQQDGYNPSLTNLCLTEAWEIIGNKHENGN
ncbi:MAG: YopX family protein [Nitrososphaerales archaeon]